MLESQKRRPGAAGDKLEQITLFLAAEVLHHLHRTKKGKSCYNHIRGGADQLVALVTILLTGGSLNEAKGRAERQRRSGCRSWTGCRARRRKKQTQEEYTAAGRMRDLLFLRSRRSKQT